LLGDLRLALQDSRVVASGSFGTGPLSAAGIITSFNGLLASTRAGAEQDLSFTAARLTQLTELQMSEGVDTDQELQNLLILERAYAANARIIKAADEMLETLMRF
jgi:flagellar hook-associated protein 1 FlgK